MTDKQQPEALRLADELEREKWHVPAVVMQAAAEELRRQHAELETLNLYKNMADEYGLSIFPDIAEMTAELETLRAKIKTYEDLGGAADDVQILRMGYAAARLEIESLRGKGWQPIDTAPRDGTFLLLWEQYSTNPFIGSWLGTRWTVSHEHVDAEGGWDGANVVDALSMPVTHWMPLPAAPGPADGESNV